MTTAPTPSRADALIREHRASMHEETLRAWASDAVDELGRLQAENERLQGSLEAQRLISDRAIALAKELEVSKNARIHKLEMDALGLASENSILKRQEAEELEARKPLPLSYRAGAMTSSVDGGATVSLHFNDMTEAEAWFVAITDQHDTALKSKAAGPLPGITGGSS